MDEAILRVVRAGPHVTVQDAGRPGMMRFGVPASGPMDRRAAAIANVALGNPAGAPVIEVSPGGLTLDCLSGALTLSVAGGGFIVDTAHGGNGGRGGSWRVFDLAQGERLTIRPGPWGSWACLAVAGSLDVPEWLGSRATHSPSGLGGGSLAAGLDLRVTGAARRGHLIGPIACPVWARPRHVLHVVTGPQDRFFPPDAMAVLTDAAFRLTEARDRMGWRLAGPPLLPQGALSIPSEAIVRGSVQVSGEGMATVLLADHQTTGGYPRIATVVADDIDGFVQCRPGDLVRFAAITPDEAVARARLMARTVARHLSALAGQVASRPGAATGLTP
jgi:allophanate hydrolase